MFVARYEAALGDSVVRSAYSVEESRERTTQYAVRTAIARDIIEKHLFGCDINPYATALTRFRLVLAACDYARPASLRDFRDLRFNIVTIDSLIPYEKLMAGGVQAGTAAARALGQPEAIERALPVLRRGYHVVVGNPPYILAQDATKRELYRENYASAYRTFGLSAPFTERFLHLALEGGRVGLINSNAFARRQFGSKLIEEILPKYDLQAVIDLSGAYIPGHGTPTLILFARNQPPSDKAVLVLSNVKGEPGMPGTPAQGFVWQSVLHGFVAGPEYADEYVDVANRPRSLLAKHPWQFGGAKSRLLQSVARASIALESIAETFGYSLQTNADEVFRVDADHARRLRLERGHLKSLLIGEPIRDWVVSGFQYYVYPYSSSFQLIAIESVPGVLRYLSAYRSFLENRVVFSGGTYAEAGRPWYEYHQFSISKHKTPYAVSFPEIATHLHFVFETGSRLFNRTAPIVKLASGVLEDYHVLLGILNTAFVCFALKQICFNKAAGDDPVRDRYVYASNYVGLIPIPKSYTDKSPSRRRMLTLVQEMLDWASQVSGLMSDALFVAAGEAYHVWNNTLDGYAPPYSRLPAPFTTPRDLRAAHKRLITLRQDVRGRMIFLQEEMDWLAYEMYGLIKKAPLAEHYLSPSQYRDARLELGQRPFELAGHGYTGDWPPGYQPAPLDEALRGLTDARIAIIRANPDIALLEDPLYKRRWVPPDYDAEFREAAAWWLAEKLEWALEQVGHPLSLREWARLMGQDERVNATLEVLTGAPSFDLEAELLKVIRANAVPNRPEHYLKASGLRKLYAARNTHYAIRSTGDTETPAPVPEFSRQDFSDATAWRLRGKLNIPRERFIYYQEFDHTPRGADAPETGGPWFGWAGWDAAGRADALAHLLDRAQRAGWEVRWRQCGLRAALRDLLPELKDPSAGSGQVLSAADRAEFESIAGICGIGLSATCFCQAYRDAFARGEAGVPGVGEEALGVKVVVQEDVKRPAGRGRKKKGEMATQLGLELR
jgi:hypothetical protein